MNRWIFYLFILIRLSYWIGSMFEVLQLSFWLKAVNYPSQRRTMRRAEQRKGKSRAFLGAASSSIETCFVQES